MISWINIIASKVTNIQEIVIEAISKKYADLFYGPKPVEGLFKFKPHKRSCILQSIKRFGDYCFKKYDNKDICNLIGPTIERYDVNKDLKDHMLVSPQFIEEKVRR